MMTQQLVPRPHRCPDGSELLTTSTCPWRSVWTPGRPGRPLWRQPQRWSAVVCRRSTSNRQVAERPFLRYPSRMVNRCESTAFAHESLATVFGLQDCSSRNRFGIGNPDCGTGESPVMPYRLFRPRKNRAPAAMPKPKAIARDSAGRLRTV